MSIETASCLPVSTVRFHDQNLLAIRDDDGNVFVAMKPIAEGMGLSWPRQFRKLQENKTKFKHCHMATVAEDGKNREVVCIPLNKLNAWLFSVNPEKVRKDIRPNVIRYQEECAFVLYEYWHKGEAVNPRFAVRSDSEPHAIPRLTTGAERKPLAVAVNKIIGMDGEGPTRQKYMAFWRALNAVLGIRHIRELTIDRLAAVQTLLEIIATLVTEPEAPKLPGALPADYEAMPMADKVNALLDAFERTVEYSQQSTFAIETKLMSIIKTVDIGPGMDHVQGMNVRQMVNDLRIGFVHAMSNVQSSLNTIRPMFWMMSAASKLGQRLNTALPSGRGRPRKALTA